MRLLTFLVAAAAAVAYPCAQAADEGALLATRLQQLLRSVGSDPGASPRYAVSDGAIAIGKQTVRITPVVESTTRQAGQFLLGVRFTVALGSAKQPQLSSGQVGIGSTVAEAVDAAVQEWYLGFGQALLKAIANERGQYKIGGLAVYPGTTGFRGQPPQGVTADTDQLQDRMLRALAPVLPLPDGQLHSLQVIVAVQPNAPPSSQVMLDGQTSEPAATLATGLRWPEVASSFMYKQAFMLR